MLSFYLFILAVLFSLGHYALRKENQLLNYVLFFNMGVMGLLAAYAHVFMGPEIAKQIGWEAGSPFQFEIGMANLSFGILGVLSFWAGLLFKAASIIGWSVLLLGCFVGHIINYYTTGNAAPFNIGVYVWFNDLILPIIALILLCLRIDKSSFSLG